MTNDYLPVRAESEARTKLGTAGRCLTNCLHLDANKAHSSLQSDACGLQTSAFCVCLAGEKENLHEPWCLQGGDAHPAVDLIRCPQVVLAWEAVTQNPNRLVPGVMRRFPQLVSPLSTQILPPSSPAVNDS
mmetsp:Transcript_18591/g.44776  ORF Transcript_18591/g.44776 Transcript_18591/m.44776 type:complete len:131 (-) Transcript_18591:300-692(-)